MNLRSITLALLMFIALRPEQISAQHPDVDWKYFGSSTQPKPGYLFYNSSDLVRTADGHIQVWTKALPQKAVDRVANAKKPLKQILDRVAQKVAGGYSLPYSAYAKITFDQYMALVVCEEIADVADIQPTMRILYEIDCPGRMFRELSIFVNIGGRSGSKDQPSEWKHVAPETNPAAIAKLVCPRT